MYVQIGVDAACDSAGSTNLHAWPIIMLSGYPPLYMHA